MAELAAENTDEANGRIENIDELITKVTEYEENTDNPSLAEFLEEVALVSEIDNLDEDSSYVVLTMPTGAKDLNFLMFSLRNGRRIIPGYMSIMSDDPGKNWKRKKTLLCCNNKSNEDLTMFSCKA